VVPTKSILSGWLLNLKTLVVKKKKQKPQAPPQNQQKPENWKGDEEPEQHNSSINIYTIESGTCAVSVVPNVVGTTFTNYNCKYRKYGKDVIVNIMSESAIDTMQYLPARLLPINNLPMPPNFTIRTEGYFIGSVIKFPTSFRYCIE
jgi:hypothetical protein